ncbi:hypothetical protein SLEP1_g17535 [Rubroshorea leprosula]|uniref:Uncharacterized protein n=1 Tax=Rubroshorea leprosula TaxID=152421 RepID=A0AAV5J3H3_9ROSI|nr:hypothetical protein SLEP1_g17535 [Rubroshorea leprosula]
MKCLMFTIFMLALLFAAGTTEVTAIMECIIPVPTKNCEDASCKNLCQGKYGPRAGHICQSCASCFCLIPC